MKKKQKLTRIATEKAPSAVGPYSQAIEAGGMVFVSGQVPLDPKTMKQVEGGIEAQTHQVLKNISEILIEAKLSFDDVVKCEVFLSDMNDFKAVNTIYGEYFNKAPQPARQAVQVAALPLGVDIEISCIAYRG